MLTDAGFDVLGVTCVFVDDDNARAAVADAQSVACALGIEHVVKDCTDRFSCTVINPFVDEYAAGRTPSPCVACNRSCKIPSLIEAADEAGCEFVATGHYARVVCRDGRFAIARAAHRAKDQSYMLAMLSHGQLARLVLPLGDVAEGKSRVRELASQWGLPVASKSDSQDICFIQGSHLDFLGDRGLAGRPGDIVTLDGRVVGAHNGLHRYTIGQRKGLDIGGAPEPYYVVEKRAASNELVVAFAADSLIDGVHVGSVSWQAITPEAVVKACAERGPLACTVKLRYRQDACACRIAPCDMQGDAGMAFVNSRGGQFRAEDVVGGICSLAVSLDAPQAATAPGQYAVFYDGDVVLGAGVIDSFARCERAVR